MMPSNRTAIGRLMVRLALLQERFSSGVALDFTTAEFLRDPYPELSRLQRHDPVHRSRLAGAWIVTSYSEIVNVLRDSRFSAERARSPMVQRLLHKRRHAPYERWMRNSILGLDPPNHGRVRNLVSKAFSARAASDARPLISAAVIELLDRVKHRHDFDIMEDFACPLPVIVMSELLGMPREGQEQVRRWSDDLGAALDPFVSLDQLNRADQAVLELREYFEPIFEHRRSHPCDDLLSSLVAAEYEGAQLSTEELYSTCILILAAGIETVTSFIGNGILALLHAPDQLDLLKAEPSRHEDAIEEMLRFAGPAQWTSRVALEDLQLGERHIREGDFVSVMLAAGNRDPAQFECPFRFDISREKHRNLAFGHGIHFCIGAPLARLQGKVAISMLLDRMPAIRLATTELEWRNTKLIRGLRHLPVTV